MPTPGEKSILRLLSQSVKRVNKTCNFDTMGNTLNADGMNISNSSNRVDEKTENHFSKDFKMSDTLKGGKEVSSKGTSNFIKKSKLQSNIQLKSKSVENANTSKRINENIENKKVRRYIKYNEKRPFTSSEIDILLKAIEKHGDDVNTKDIAKAIGRQRNSVKRKIDDLKAGSVTKKGFTLMDDIMIIDTYCKKLKNGQKFKCMGSVPMSELYQLSLTMKRKQIAVLGRWMKYLKPWILQYFSGTLNLQTVPMLVDYLVDNFTQLDSIDWSSVILKPEFSGHTETSLRGLLHNNMMEAKRNLKKEEIDFCLLKEYIDQKLKEGKFRKISDKIKTRQMDVVKYFQEYLDTNNTTEIF